MSKENRQVPEFESLYDVGDENFSLSKSLEVGPIDLVVSSSSFFSGGLHTQKKKQAWSQVTLRQQLPWSKDINQRLGSDAYPTLRSVSKINQNKNRNDK